MFARIGRTASIALAFITLGFVIIGLAWNGAASVDHTSGQIPFLISGGVGGLALVLVGAGLLLFEAGRRHLGRLERKFDELIAATQARAPAAAPVEEKPAKKPGLNGQVVVGRSSFHRPDCRLVQGKEDLDYASSDEAVARGLQPCRVCDPTKVTPTGRKGR